MKYNEQLIIYSIKYPFAENNMDVVIRFLVNKYNYLLKTMIETIDENADESDLYDLYDEPVSDIIDNMLLSIMFPYIKDFNPELDMEKRLCNYFNKYICNISVDLINEKKEISNTNITFNENVLLSKFKGVFSMNEIYWDNPIKLFIKKNEKVLRKASLYVYDCHWNKETTDRRKRNLRNKIDNLYTKLTKSFSSFFAYSDSISIEDTFNLTNQFVSNYSKVYNMNSELLKYTSDDISMIIIYYVDLD